MPVHDWTRVDAGTFHAFHLGWITHLSEALNGGILPPGYYAMAEQHGGRIIADILTLRSPPSAAMSPAGEGGLAFSPSVFHPRFINGKTVPVRYGSESKS